MSAGSHDDHFDQMLDQRSLKRRRWFEHAVMLPVSLGMVATFVLYGGRDLMVHFSGQAGPLQGVPDWAFFLLACAIGISGLRLIRR